MQLEEDDRVEDVPPPTNDMQDLLAVDVDAKNEWDLWDISPCSGIDAKSSLRGNFLAIEEKCVCMA